VVPVIVPELFDGPPSRYNFTLYNIEDFRIEYGRVLPVPHVCGQQETEAKRKFFQFLEKLSNDELQVPKPDFSLDPYLAAGVK